MQLKHGAAIDDFDKDHADPKVRVRVWDLIERCCTFVGVSADTLPTVDEEAHKMAITKRTKNQKEYEEAQKKAKAAAGSSSEHAASADARSSSEAAALGAKAHSKAVKKGVSASRLEAFARLKGLGMKKKKKKPPQAQ